MRVGEIGHFEESRFRQPLRYKYLKRKNRVWNYFCPKLIFYFLICQIKLDNL